MAAADPNLEWLGHVQPTGLVIAPAILTRYGLLPEGQIRADGDAVDEHLAEADDGPALLSPWTFFEAILGWQAAQVAGAPGGPTLPEHLAVHLPDADTTLLPTWALAEPDGGWQMLVRIEAPGVDPDKRAALDGWEATPHQRLERLLRETGIPTGLLVTDHHLRLVYAPRGETSGWLAFPLRDLANVGGRPMLGGLKLLLSAFRLFNDSAERRLPGLLRASREAQAEVSARLAIQVLGALHELLRGLHAADRARTERLAAQRPAHLYEGLLTVLLRLVFLLYAEDRALIPSRADGQARALYEEGYGVRALHSRLLADAARYPDTMDERRGAWSRLLALFRLVHAGDVSGWIRGRGGKLFDPAMFPFLLGQDGPETLPEPASVTDGCILRVLDGLMVLAGERLSYRTLDVEQIGSVYETVMGFTVLAMRGPALAIRAGKNHRTPVFVDLAALATRKPADREKFLKDEADRAQLPARVKHALTAASSPAALAEALRPIVDERGSPGGHTAPPGTPLLQPTDERRRTGSHYTPRSLTEPIVRHALEPAFERIGEDATPEQVLALKVCDPAMGSGAFLVETCRQLATRLVRAWARHRGTRPEIPPDEDEDLLARRLVAQRCLYGVDRNPMATDLARLSLWLVTLARDHEFTFLDHALKTGDSLVGLTAPQIGALTWGDDRQGSLFGRFVAERLEKVVQGRDAIREAPDDVLRAMQEAKHAVVETTMADVRLLGDAVLACFFAEAKPKARQAALHALQDLGGRDNEAMWAEVRKRANALAQSQNSVRPFHWEIEFPEVFATVGRGFDAVVGNPPFLGGKRISSVFGEVYAQWLGTIHENSPGSTDLVAHFFRRAFGVVRPGGCLGLLATNTIYQGDTREGGLQQILTHGGAVLHAVRRMRWPGEAAVVVSVVHIIKGTIQCATLDGKLVRRISAYLVEGNLDESPNPLAANDGISFNGCFIMGLGFTFDDDAAAKGRASTISEMRRLIAADNRNSERIFPYLGSEELNGDAAHTHRRWVIDFNDFPHLRAAMKKDWAKMDARERTHCRSRGVVPLDYPDPVAADWPDLMAIIERLVRPERLAKKGSEKDAPWWLFFRPRPTLRAAIASMDHMLVTGAAAVMHHMIARVSSRIVPSHKLTVFATGQNSSFAKLQCRSHELWSREFGATFGSVDALTYNPKQVFRPFPFPCAHDEELSKIGGDYHNHRAALMIARNEGLTKTYNRFHDPAERARDVQRLRELQHAMDVAVLRAYGWDDLADRAAPEFLTEASEPDHRYQGRLFWVIAFRDEVLARLLDLNRARAEEERRLGLSPRGATLPDDDDTDEAA